MRGLIAFSFFTMVASKFMLVQIEDEGEKITNGGKKNFDKYLISRY